MMANFAKMTVLGLSAFGLLGFAQPVLADGGAARSASASTAGTTETAKAKPAKAEKHCVNTYADTGSRLGRKECKTKKEWAAEGVEITSKK